MDFQFNIVYCNTYIRLTSLVFFGVLTHFFTFLNKINGYLTVLSIYSIAKSVKRLFRKNIFLPIIFSTA